jgi:hypothetical protein
MVIDCGQHVSKARLRLARLRNGARARLAGGSSNPQNNSSTGWRGRVPDDCNLLVLDGWLTLAEDILASQEQELLREAAQDHSDPFALSKKFDEIVGRVSGPQEPRKARVD